MTNDEVNRWKLSAERIAELRGFIDQLLSTHNMYECIAIRDMLSEEITHEPSELRPPVKLEDYGPVIDEVAPVTKEAWDAMKPQGASRDASLPPLTPYGEELLSRAKLCQCGICEACEFAEKHAQRT